MSLLTESCVIPWSFIIHNTVKPYSIWIALLNPPYITLYDLRSLARRSRYIV